MTFTSTPTLIMTVTATIAGAVSMLANFGLFFGGNRNNPLGFVGVLLVAILAPMAAEGLAKVYLSVTTLERELARRLEPRAPAPKKRLAAIEGLSAAGVPVGVIVAPIIPALNDWELKRILEAAAGSGARSAGYVLLRLPLEIKEIFTEWLETHIPDRKARIMKLVRETRGGALYDPTWSKRQSGEGVFAKLLADRFALACRPFGLVRTQSSSACIAF